MYTLQSELETLEQTVGEPADESSSESPSASTRSRRLPGHSERLSALEQEMRDLETTLGGLSRQAEACVEKAEAHVDRVVDSNQMQQRIVDVMQAEEERVLGTQLQWHRDQLMKAREKGLDQLAEQGNLSDSQKEELTKLMEDESDAILELIKDPEMRENLDVGLKELRNLLDATDEKARQILDPDQMKLYKAGREVEQATLAPWLPAK